jgi:O-antigen ligase
LAAALITTTAKAILAAAVISLVVAAIVWAVMIVFELALATIAIGVITIVVGFIANYAIEATDKFAGRVATHDPSNTDGTASVIAPWIRKARNLIEENWHYLMYRMSKDYQEIQF